MTISRGDDVRALSVEYDVPVSLRDGVTLAADVFRPAGDGRYPVILIRTPYNKADAPGGTLLSGFDIVAAARAGYVVVIQDTRGAFASEGTLSFFANDPADGADTVKWAASQPWSAGQVATAGRSYVGATQLMTAIRRPNALRAMVPSLTASEYYDGWVYQGGALQLGFLVTWTTNMALADAVWRERRGEDCGQVLSEIQELLADPLCAMTKMPVRSIGERIPAMDIFREWLTHPDRDDYWRATAINEHYSAIDVPGLHIAGWHDIFLKGSLDNYVGLRAHAATQHARDHQRLVICPWGHGVVPNESVGELSFGAGATLAAVDVHGMHMRWYDAFLKGKQPIGEEAPVRLFVMGENRWRAENEWPLERARLTPWFLGTGNGLSLVAPAEEATDEFFYDPRNPVPTVGGQTVLPGGGMFLGPRDRRAVGLRRDVLVYSSAPLDEDVEVTGPVRAVLYVASSAVDTDFTVALVDVHADGRAIGLADGILRLRYREGLDRPRLLEPGRAYRVEIDLVATSNVFKRGHRIRVDISSSNFPRFDRNPNDGRVVANARAGDIVIAHQHVFHGGERSSHIALPIVYG